MSVWQDGAVAAKPEVVIDLRSDGAGRREVRVAGVSAGWILWSCRDNRFGWRPAGNAMAPITDATEAALRVAIDSGVLAVREW